MCVLCFHVYLFCIIGCIFVMCYEGYLGKMCYDGVKYFICWCYYEVVVQTCLLVYVESFERV